MFVIRFLDDNFNIHEKSIGCYHMVKSASESLFNQIINIISENNLNINKCVAKDCVYIFVDYFYCMLIKLLL